MTRTLISLALLLTSTALAVAAPVLRANVSVTGEIVTVGDMFSDAGLLAEAPLFRAPAPGTSGLVPVDAIRAAVSKVGLKSFDVAGLEAVRVARDATEIDATTLGSIVANAMLGRNLVPAGVTITTTFDSQVVLKAAAEDNPVDLLDLAYAPGGRLFTATFRVAGQAQPVVLTGRVQLTVAVPHLAQTLKAGDVITPDDIEMRDVPLEFADQSGVETPADLIGKAVRRNTRAGVMLRASDITEPLAVTHNTIVTVKLTQGPLTLTVQGRALTDAIAGGDVQVMNTVTHKILTGTATALGIVEVQSANMTLAGL